MKVCLLPLFIVLFSVSALAQEQMALRLNEKGILKILEMGLQYNSASKEKREILIPSNLYEFSVPKETLLSNPIVMVANEISDLNLTRDLDFYFRTSDIKIEGSVDQKSLKVQIFNSHDLGFDVKITLSLPEVRVSSDQMSLCEDKSKAGTSCGSGLKATISGVNLKTKKKPITLSMVLRLRTDGRVARVLVQSVNSNLDDNNAPELDVNFRSIQIPKIAIIINGQETELDTSKLKNEILKRKAFLGSKLLSFAADFIANDVAEMLNVYLMNQEVLTSYNIYRKENPVRFDEFLFDREFFPVDHRDLLPPLRIPQAPAEGPALMSKIAGLIRSAELDIALRKISTPLNKDIQLSGQLGFQLNGKTIKVSNKLGNSNRELPSINLTPHREHDLNLAISEPLINGALDVANSVRLFQRIFEEISPVQGFNIKSVKAHFSGNSAIVAVVNAQIDLKRLESNGVGSWIKNRFAAWLERNNNNAVIYFPIEVSIIPVFKKLPTGEMTLDLKVLSPFTSDQLLNRFNYPTNVPDMTDTVKKGVMEVLRESLEPHTNKTYSVDLTNFLNQSGVVFLPKDISINQGAYLLLNMDIVDIKFNSQNPNLR